MRADERWQKFTGTKFTGTVVVGMALGIAGACSSVSGLQTKHAPTQAEVAKMDDFAGTDHRGREFSLEDARSEGPVVLVFYRGHW